MEDQQQARSNPFSDALYFYLSGNYRCAYACLRELDDVQLLLLSQLSKDGLIELMALDKYECIGLSEVIETIHEHATSEQYYRLSNTRGTLCEI